MKIKKGDIVEFIGISWDNNFWEYDYSTTIISPVLQYSPSGICPESMIEDICIDATCNDEIKNHDIEDDLKWVGCSLNWIKRVIREKFQGKDTLKTRVREVVKQTIEFYEDEDGLNFKIINTQKL